MGGAVSRLFRPVTLSTSRKGEQQSHQQFSDALTGVAGQGKQGGLEVAPIGACTMNPIPLKIAAAANASHSAAPITALPGGSTVPSSSTSNGRPS